MTEVGFDAEYPKKQELVSWKKRIGAGLLGLGIFGVALNKILGGSGPESVSYNPELGAPPADISSKVQEAINNPAAAYENRKQDDVLKGVNVPETLNQIDTQQKISNTTSTQTK